MRWLPLAVAVGCAAPPDCPDGLQPDGTLCVQPPPAERVWLQGPVTIASVADAEALCADGNAVRGDLVLVGLRETDALACLVDVAGDLVVDDVDGLRRLVLPRLESVSGDLSIQHNRDLTGVGLSALQRVGGGVAIHYNEALRGVRADWLRATDRYLSIYDNRQLEALALPALERVGPMEAYDGASVFYVRLNASLPELRLPALRSVSVAFKLTGNDALAVVDAPQLGYVGDLVYLSFNAALDSVELPVHTTRRLFVDRSWLRSVSFPALEELPYNLSLLDNLRLESLDFPALRSVGGPLEVRGDPALPESAVQALLDQVGDVPNGIDWER